MEYWEHGFMGLSGNGLPHGNKFPQWNCNDWGTPHPCTNQWHSQLTWGYESSKRTHTYIYICIYIYIHTHTNMYTVLYIVQEDYVFLFMGIPLDSWIWELEDYVFFNPGMVTDMHKVKTAWLFCVMVNKQLRSFSNTPKFYTTTLWYVYVWGKSAINI